MRPAPALATLLLISTSLLASATAVIDLDQVGETSLLADRIDNLVTPYVNLGMFNGVVLVAQGEQVRFIKPDGKANYCLDVPLATETRFRIASLS